MINEKARLVVTTALLKPCFFKNKVKIALASSFSAANRFAGTTLKLNGPSILVSPLVLLD